MPKSSFSLAANRTAMMTVGRMPVIAEDASLPPVTDPSPAQMPLPHPPPSCRSTKLKPYPRSPAKRPVYSSRHSYPPPAYSRPSSRDSSHSTLSSQGLLSNSSNLGRWSSSDQNSGTSTPRSTYRDRSLLLPVTTPARPSALEKKGMSTGFFGGQRGWYRLLVVVILGVGLIVGLSVGLTTWRRESSQSTTAGPPLSSNVFPAGSFAFSTSLLKSSEGCTSDPSTWRCLPLLSSSSSSSFNSTSLVTFFWTIAPLNSYAYQVSSSPSSSSVLGPVAPQFTNLTMTLLDGNSYNERFIFNFSFPRTVSLAGNTNSTSDNGTKTTTCTFPNTTFSATVWTRRNATAVAVASQSGGNATTTTSSTTATTTAAAMVSNNITNWPEWPGEVTVAVTKTGGSGTPECRDADGEAVEVAAGPGSCECVYADYGG